MNGDEWQGMYGSSARARARTVPGIGRPPWLLPFALIVLGVLLELVTPPGLLVGTVFDAAPLVAAALWTTRGTLITSAATLLAVIGLMIWWVQLTMVENMLRLTTLTGLCLLAVVINRALLHSDVRLASAHQMAEAFQLAMLPAPPARVGELTFAVRYEAAQAYTRVGGDLYGVQRTPYGVRLLVADVRGKGLDAVGMVTTVLGAFREAADDEPDLPSVADRIEHALYREDEQGRTGTVARIEGFATAVLVEIPLGTPEQLRIVNRGHPPPLLLTGDGASVRALEPEAYELPLGFGDLMDGAEKRVQSVPFPPGAMVLLHTDGVTEARNAEGEFYDPAAALRGRSFHGPGALLDALLADVSAHTGGHADDDVALLAVARDATRVRAEPRTEYHRT
ncbi:MAG TPA: PP2C family protein-serine/threonine phosphatase [Streptomyces sp.]|nr:PP2C family protein-serine/threonine phosphatase [Streptomyces sp.]